MARKVLKADADMMAKEAKLIMDSSAGKFNEDDSMFIAQELTYLRSHRAGINLSA